RGEVVLRVGVLDVGQELAAVADQVRAAAQQIAGGPHRHGIDVGHGDHAAPQEHGDLVGVDLVVLRLPTVDRLHVECVPEDEGDALRGADVGQPVPGEDALDGHHDVVAVWSEHTEEVRGC